MIGNGASQPMSGPELMLRRFGLGEVLDMAKQLASQGTLEEIMAFGKEARSLTAAIRDMQAQVKRLALAQDLLVEKLAETFEADNEQNHFQFARGQVRPAEAGGGPDAGPGPGARHGDDDRSASTMFIDPDANRRS